MNFLGDLLEDLEFGSAGSRETANAVLDMCGKISPERAVFVGDDCYTPALIQKKLGCSVTAAYADDVRAEKAAAEGINVRSVQSFEIPEAEGGYDLLWYNGVVEFDGVDRRLAQLRSLIAKGGTAVYRTLCWLIDPSPDTLCYCEKRFGIIEPLDRVIIYAKEQGFRVNDFYIAPKSDWTEHHYKPLSEAAGRCGASIDGDAAAGMTVLEKEEEMFELHCEEYSYVYYILKG